MEVGIQTFEAYENRRYNSVGSSRIRGRWVLKHWDEAEQYLAGKRYDVIIFQKAYNKKLMKNFDGIKIFDLCDKDWPDRPVVEVMEMVDAVTVPTESLKEALESMKGNLDIPIVVIPDRIDFDSVKRLKNSYKGKIEEGVWYGYSENFKTMKPALIDLEEMGIDLTVISEQEIKIRGYDIRIEPQIYDQDTIYKELAKHDVVFNPRIEKGKWKMKSNNKTIIAEAVGCPVVHSLDELKQITNPEDRKKHMEKRYKYVRENYDVKDSVKQYKELISTLSK